MFQGQIVKRGYDQERCFSVELIGSSGKQIDYDDLTSVTLYTSDDKGESYVDQGTVNITPSDLDRRVQWRSLGSFTTPGRLFKFVDYGALARIDYISMESDRE